MSSPPVEGPIRGLFQSIQRLSCASELLQRNEDKRFVRGATLADSGGSGVLEIKLNPDYSRAGTSRVAKALNLLPKICGKRFSALAVQVARIVNNPGWPLWWCRLVNNRGELWATLDNELGLQVN